ncbi:MAG: hypothetical protein IT292_07335 [Deltaproteobacteria bacterium]|nr:hypothetical protein [Deltaproteobacteria bacterium]
MMRLADILVDKELREQSMVCLFFIALLLLGLFIFSDYGISWDEPAQRQIAEHNYNYIFHSNDSLLWFKDRFYGVAFELPAYMIEKLIGIEDSQSSYFFRHLLIFLVFYLGVYFFYKLNMLYFNRRLISLTACLFLVLSPRIFAHAFYNSKDLVFLSIFIISIYTMLSYHFQPTRLRLLAHVLLSALLINVRVIGIVVVAGTFLLHLGMMLVDCWNKNYRQIPKRLLEVIIYFVATAVLLLATWPILWSDPINNFIKTIEVMANFPWYGYVLYSGVIYQSDSLPWHYVPFWIAISTPLIYLFLFILGLIKYFVFIGKEKWQTFKNRETVFRLVFLAWLFLVMAYVMAYRPIIYNGGRQLYFIYPALIIIATDGLLWLYKAGMTLSLRAQNFYKSVLLVIVAATLFPVASFMITAHPYQDVYFNEIIGKQKNIQTQFEFDYWGLSCRQAMEYIASIDKREGLLIGYDTNSPINNISILPEADRRRMRLTNRPYMADYFLPYRSRSLPLPPYCTEISAITVNDSKLLPIYKCLKPLNN